jgi:hypothetical protein
MGDSYDRVRESGYIEESKNRDQLAFDKIVETHGKQDAEDLRGYRGDWSKHSEDYESLDHKPLLVTPSFNLSDCEEGVAANYQG